MRIDKVIEILDSRKPPESEQDFEDFDTAMETAINLLKTYHDNRLNDPLTLEQLREMDGEPVFIKCLFNDELSSYVVVDKRRDSAGIFTRLFYASFDYYGDEWLAYRRKPEPPANAE